jgi:A/G-specific adenine glycosylase
MILETEIRKKIRKWYLDHQRNLPWRKTSDPYKIWVSEVILQQTRVDQGTKYYHRFLRSFPDIQSLANAEEAEVLKAWEGMGYYSRARNLHTAAKTVQSEYGGSIPRSFEGLLEMKGIGPYTAAAVSSIAFGEARAVVDGNAHRVISRIYGIPEPAGKTGPASLIRSKATALLDPEDPGTHNQAIMELGALICTPSRPACISCPVRGNCKAYTLGRVEELPVRKRPPSRRTRYFHYLVIHGTKGIWLGLRKDRDIWHGLYEFPLIESETNIPMHAIIQSAGWRKILGGPVSPHKVHGPFKHILSHQEILATFYDLREPSSFRLRGYEPVDAEHRDRYPLPKLILNYLNRNND